MENLNYNSPSAVEMLGMEALPVEMQTIPDNNLDGTCAVVRSFLFAVHEGKIYVQVYNSIAEVEFLIGKGFTQNVHPTGLRAYLRTCDWYQSVFDAKTEDFPPYFKALYYAFIEREL